jgi:hypothetical protein
MNTYCPGIGLQGLRNNTGYLRRYLGCYFSGNLTLNRNDNNFTGMCVVTMQATFDSTTDEVAM